MYSCLLLDGVQVIIVLFVLRVRNPAGHHHRQAVWWWRPDVGPNQDDDAAVVLLLAHGRRRFRIEEVRKSC